MLGIHRRVRFRSLLPSLALALPLAAQPHRVVILYDERTDLPGLASLDAQLVSTLATEMSGNVTVYRESMELSRFQSPDYPTALAHHLQRKYAEQHIEVVIAVMGPALDFVLANPRMFPGASVVFCGIDRRELSRSALPANVTGVFVKREFRPTLDLALALHADTKRVIVVSGSASFDQRLLDAAREEFRDRSSSLPIDYIVGRPLSELVTTLSNLPPRNIVLFLSMFADSLGTSYVPHDAVRRIATAANAPVYGFVDQFVGRGIVGGHVYSLAMHGANAARLAARLLRGAKASAIPPVDAVSNVDQFDWRQLKRWHIAEERLPEDAAVLFRDPSVWERYRHTILAATGVMLLQLGLIVWLLVERRIRHAAVRVADEQQRELVHLGRVAIVNELASTLAHETSQPLTAILTNASVARRMVREGVSDPDEFRHVIDDIVTNGSRAAAVIRGVRGLIKDAAVDRKEVAINDVACEAVELAHGDLVRRNVIVEMRLAPERLVVMADRVQLQQVLLNLILNACEAMLDTPARERKLAVSTTLSGHVVHITVEDCGHGIPAHALEDIFSPFRTTKPQGLGLGLAICRSIIGAHGGRVVAANNSERGATFTVSLPVLRTAALPAPQPEHATSETEARLPTFS